MNSLGDSAISATGALAALLATSSVPWARRARRRRRPQRRSPRRLRGGVPLRPFAIAPPVDGARPGERSAATPAGESI